MPANPPPLDAAARDELARKAEEVIELRLLYKGAPLNGFSQFDVRAALDHAEEALDAAGSPEVILALLASVRGAEAERDAWREYAVHLEWCRSCAEDGMDSCHEGKALRDAARAHPPTTETDDAE